MDDRVQELVVRIQEWGSRTYPSRPALTQYQVLDYSRSIATCHVLGVTMPWWVVGGLYVDLGAMINDTLHELELCTKEGLEAITFAHALVKGDVDG